jgi:diguanylate cyclase (GGDEF)-like protein/PAS domain S-box-containing protein
MPRLGARLIEGEKLKVSPAIYAALVDSLFQNSASMFLGTLCAGVAALMTAVKTGDPWLWPCAAFIVLAGIVRSVQMRKYETRKTTIGEAEARIWEVRYSIGSFLHAASLGIWCFVTLIGSDDPIAHLLCTASTIGYTAAGAGRNYGRPWIVQLHTVLACGPMALGLMLQGNRYYIGLGILLILFYAGLRKINISLHEIFANLLISRERESNIARQFDTALNNMPHGLCMFGADGRVAVINDRFNDMMGIERDRELLGSSLRELLSAGVGTNTISSECADDIVSEVRRARAAEITTENAGAGADRALEWTFQPMHGGGTVMLVEDVTERRNAQARINRMARYDELTGLPNRQSFRDEIAGYLAAGGKSAALLFIDLDQFKQVNDTLGHPAGDKLLCAVTGRLREVLGPDDYVARFGGDEFVVFQRNVQTREQSAELAAKIVDRLSERYEIDHHLIEIGASIGIAVTASGVGADALLKHADMALYRAKADGRGTYCFFREEMAESVEARRTLEIDLRQALAKEEFELYFQPLVNLKSGRISTCEALLRWRHPTRGLVSPADIIPVAEEIGLIIDLGRWILRKACMECMTWPEQVRVAVNLSPLQFHQRNVLDDIRYALSVSGLPAKRLEIEITESSLMRNTQWTRDALEQLRKEGVSISLDDFGTGYSSLSYLHSFPLHKVKIDRSFLEGIREDKPLTLLRGVARLSADIGMQVVVEGIETNEQLEIVAADGTVTEAQGYLFGRPVAASQIRQLLAASHGRGGDRLKHIASVG